MLRLFIGHCRLSTLWPRLFFKIAAESGPMYGCVAATAAMNKLGHAKQCSLWKINLSGTRNYSVAKI